MSKANPMAWSSAPKAPSRPLMGAKGWKPAALVLSVDCDGEVQVRGQLPEPVIFGVVQPLALGQQGVAHRCGAQLLHGPPGLGHHLVHVTRGKDSGELHALGVNAAILVAPVMVGARHGGAQFGVLEGDLSGKVAVAARGQNHLYVPSKLCPSRSGEFAGDHHWTHGLAVLLLHALVD